jgi:hypothetical protein
MTKKGKGKKDKPGLKQILRLVILVLILLIVLSALALYREFGLSFGLYRKSSESSSQTMDIRNRDLERLYTAEVVWDLVFPHDFFPDPRDWEIYQAKLRTRQTLEPDEWALDRFRRLCEETGFRAEPGGTEFFVLRVVVRGGYDFSDKGNLRIPGTAQPLLRWDQDTLVIHPPEVEILSVRVEDPRREEYKFPDVPLSPEKLRLITAHVSRAAEEKALQWGLLEEARTNGQSLLTRMFNDAGITNLKFVED